MNETKESKEFIRVGDASVLKKHPQIGEFIESVEILKCPTTGRLWVFSPESPVPDWVLALAPRGSRAFQFRQRLERAALKSAKAEGACVEVFVGVEGYSSEYLPRYSDQWLGEEYFFHRGRCFRPMVSHGTVDVQGRRDKPVTHIEMCLV